MALYHRVHSRLRRRGFIRFVVAAPAVANKINDNVFFKFVTEIQSKLCHEKHCFGVVCIDVKYRRLHHASNVCAIFGGAGVILTACREADLIINDNMYGAARSVSAGLRHLECFHDDTLSCKCCVSMDNNREDFRAVSIATPNLACAHRAFDYRRYNL